MSAASTEQATLPEFAEPDRCRAISVRTSRRCEHDALPGIPYCADHYHLLEDDTLSTRERSA